jgi:hypothetical protein
LHNTPCICVALWFGRWLTVSLELQRVSTFRLLRAASRALLAPANVLILTQSCSLRTTASSDSFLARVFRSPRRSVRSCSLCLISANSLSCSRNACLACQRTPLGYESGIFWYYYTHQLHEQNTCRMTSMDAVRSVKEQASPRFPSSHEERADQRGAKIRGESDDRGIRAIGSETSKERAT